MGTVTAVSKSFLYKTSCLVLLMITAFSASGYSQIVVRENIADHQRERVSVENLEEPKTVVVDIMRSNVNSGNSYAEEFWRQTNKAYEQEAKALANYTETYNETMGMVREELRKWQGDYAEGYNETMGMVQSELRKFRGPELPDESSGQSLLPGNRSLPDSSYGEGGIKSFKRPVERDTILGPWELPEAPQPFDKFQPGLPPSF